MDYQPNRPIAHYGMVTVMVMIEWECKRPSATLKFESVRGPQLCLPIVAIHRVVEKYSQYARISDYIPPESVATHTTLNPVTMGGSLDTLSLKLTDRQYICQATRSVRVSILLLIPWV